MEDCHNLTIKRGRFMAWCFNMVFIYGNPVFDVSRNMKKSSFGDDFMVQMVVSSQVLHSHSYWLIYKYHPTASVFFCA